MDDYAGRVLADRYRLPLPPSDAYELIETRAFDTYSGQEVLVRQVPLPEVVDAEVLDADGGVRGVPAPRRAPGRATRRPSDPAVLRAVEAAQAAAQIPDHPRLDQVFDVFAEDGSLWIVSELVAARPLAALLAEKPLDPYRAAEIASDVLTALRALHVHGWTHRNITVRTVLVCDDGRVVLTGLAAGAAEEALCGYAPVPDPADEVVEADPVEAPDPYTPPAYGYGFGQAAAPVDTSLDTSVDTRAVRAGAIAAYRAGAARAGARLSEDRRQIESRGTGGTGGTGGQEGSHGVERLHHPGVGDEPRWWSRPTDDNADDNADADADAAVYEGEVDPDDPAPYRAELAGTWRDGPVPDGPASLPAGGGPSPYGRDSSVGADALRADARRAGTGGEAGRPEVRGRGGHGPVQLPAQSGGRGRWDEAASGGSGGAATGTGAGYRGPATPLAAERARQARIAVVGAVTERWAPEQAGPVHGTWQLAPPVGPATDLWALGALLYRAVQGHAPYPEESAVELVQLVCAEPPAFAEECGPLRPVVESLLRQDPTERPDFEELRGWLRSLVRSAPEPDAGAAVVALPSVDAGRLPVVRRRGELVRRRRGGTAATAHGRHRHRKSREQPRAPREARRPVESGERSPRGGPRSLGRTLLVLILLALAAAIAYAVLFMPKAGEAASGTGGDGTAPAGRPSAPAEGASSGGQQPQTSAPAVDLADGYVARIDPEGFRIGVDKTWQRRPVNDSGQVRYIGGDFTLIVVPGRDSVRDHGADPMAYQRDKERELQPFRDSSWASSTGLRRIDVGKQAMAEGQFTWQDSSGREVYVRNLALIVADRYHVIQVIGPEAERDKVTEIYQQATAAYQAAR
ncbi:protein kinase [Streptomyces sp. FIT100]|uniref:protein kinase n=1 Tax=Streptomyces sp. FIT100 TaxID=2837956 RepID=UPI0021C8E5E1|nr:protein kinase [Streptomyces sp. FIT100]UUN28685.1 protein kinase [Streptomyces sp. FIT100]